MLVDWFTVLAQIGNFLILIYLLKRFLYGPILRAMEAREEKIAGAMEQATKAELESRQRGAELEKEKQALLEARDSLLAEAGKEVQAWREKAMQEIRLEVERLKKGWVTRILQEKQAFLNTLREQVAKHVVSISEKVLEDLANERLEKYIVTAFLKKLRDEVDPESLRNVSEAVHVQTGFEMDVELADEVRRQLVGSFPNAPSIEFEVLEQLGVGLQVLAGDRKLDWTLNHYLEGLEKEIFADFANTAQGTA